MTLTKAEMNERWGPLRMNLGCGPRPEVGWVNVDHDDYGWNAGRPLPGEEIIVGDVTARLPFEPKVFDYAVANHVMQMVGYHDLPRALTEVWTVLVPGGVFRVLVPDPLAAFAAHGRGDHAWFPVADAVEPTIGGKLSAYLTWYSEARSLFTLDYLWRLLADVGFAEITQTPFQTSVLLPGSEITALDSRPHESLIVEARRPLP